MTLVVALQRAPYQCVRLFEGEILRMKGDDCGLAPEVPQQALLGDALRDPRHDPLPQPSEPRAVARRRGAAAATLLRLMEHHREPVPDASDDPARGWRELGFLNRRFAVQLVAVGPDWNHEHVHSRTIADFRSSFVARISGSR